MDDLKREVSKVRWLFERPKAIEAYLSSHPVRKLQIGTGITSLPGWLNTDREPLSHGVVYLDASEPFPFEARTFDFIFTEHLIEHLPYERGIFMLSESLRILKPGGWIRVATPSLERLVSLFAEKKDEEQKRYLEWTVDTWLPDLKILKQAGFNIYRETFALNNAFYNFGHRFLYDRDLLEKTMAFAGFREITPCKPGESRHEAFRGIESHGKAVGNEAMNRFETMVLEGRSP